MSAPWIDYQTSVVNVLKADSNLITTYAGGDAAEWAKRVTTGPIDRHSLPRLQQLPMVVVGEIETDLDLDTFESDAAQVGFQILCMTSRERFGAAAATAHELGRDCLKALRAGMTGIENEIDGSVDSVAQTPRTRNVIMTLKAPISVARATVD